MSGWLRSLMRRKTARPTPTPVVELLVLEGVDAGEQYTVDGDEVHIGRRLPTSAQARGVLLRDPTVSAKQAVIRRKGAELVLQHLDSATNPTLLDGRPARGEALRIGSRIRIGGALLEVRESEGLAISDLTQVFSVEAKGQGASGQVSDPDPSTTRGRTESSGRPADAQTTAVRPVVSQLGQLVVVRGAARTSDKRFPIWSTRTRMGRSADCDVQISDRGVSRNHAELLLEAGGLVLAHQSKVNPTLLNGREVLDREPICSGDTIQLADAVELRVELHPPGRGKSDETAEEARRRGLKQRMEQRLALDDDIEQRFSVQGSFLDVDVVDSYGMKAQPSRADHIVVSFERFRAFVGGVVVEHGGHVLNSNGDELMCYFESTLDAVRAGSRILTRLEEFNADENVLSAPFRFRLGIHTGRSLVDLDQGVAYSPVLDVAGHLQKRADVNSLFVSEDTIRALPEELPFEPVGLLEKEGIACYRLVGEID